MDNNFENNTNTEDNTPDHSISETEKPVYTDPNADVREEVRNTDNGEVNVQNDSSSEPNNNYQGYWDNQSQYNQSRDTQYNQNAQYNQNTQYSPGGSNYSYNVNPNQPYNNEAGYDATPMTMGDWLLVILVTLIPCAGIILYFVWAFSKTGNINRRNYCRAALIFQGAVFVISIILLMIMGGAILSAWSDYYYY